jgi:MoxR-like ATPase
MHATEEGGRPVMTALVSTTEPGLDAIDEVRSALNASLRGKRAVVEHVLACLLARGHMLIEDLPGLGKTTLAKAMAHALGGKFARVQCTPDLLPGDITGFRVFDQQTREFEFLPGPVFADVLLADEINRATPRTQSALLESMAERQATIDNVRHVLSDSFFVIATQNPVEQHGTYPLPEAQLDRFAMKLRIGYPDRDHEMEMLEMAVGTALDRGDGPARVLGPGQLRALQDRVAHVNVGEAVRDYLVRLAHASRVHRQVTLGLSPRGLLIWQRLAQARAFLDARDFVTPDDVQDVAYPTLEVRLGIEPEAADRVLAEIFASVPVPVDPRVSSGRAERRREKTPRPPEEHRHAN